MKLKSKAGITLLLTSAVAVVWFAYIQLVSLYRLFITKGIYKYPELSDGEWLNKSSGFMPRFNCGFDWNSRLIAIHEFGQMSIFIWYSLIPLSLFWILYMILFKLQVPGFWPLGLILAGLFVWSCGYTHWLGYKMFSEPMYFRDGFYLLVCSASSVAFLLWTVVGTLFPKDLRSLAYRVLEKRSSLDARRNL